MDNTAFLNMGVPYSTWRNFMKKLISVLAVCLCLGCATALSSCVQIVDPEQLYSSFINQSKPEESSSVEEQPVEYANVETLAQLKQALIDNLNPRLLADIEYTPTESEDAFTATITIPAEMDLHIDLNGFNLSIPESEDAAQHYFAVENLGKLTVVGNGILSGGGILNKGELIIHDGVTITTSTQNAAAATIQNEGSLLIKGGKFEATYAGVEGEATGPVVLNNLGTAIIEAGIFHNKNQFAFVIVTGDSLKINDATVIGEKGAILIKDGALTINDGNIYAAKDSALHISGGQTVVSGGIYTGGSLSDGYDIKITEQSSLLAINGGTLTNGKIYNGGAITLNAGATVTPEQATNAVDENGRPIGILVDNRNPQPESSEESSVENNSPQENTSAENSSVENNSVEE